MMNQAMTERVDMLEKWIQESNNVVFFGGAGVSTESGIPDFRSVDGLYNQQYDYPPETIISHSFYRRNPEEFYRFYKNKMLFPNAKPNAAHLALAKLEQQGKVRAVITQNIDGLHQAAGSREVLELHGSVHRNYCTRCGKFFDLATIMGMESVPRCECGGIIKPDVVLYEEGLDQTTLQKAVRYIQEADILILSLLVIQCALGLLTIPFSAQHMDGSEMMKLVGWAQSVVTFHGGASQHLDGVAFIFRLHLVLGMTLFLLFPFSRLVHIWSVPVEYLTRKYQLVRARH